MIDYTIWSPRELIEEIHRLQSLYPELKQTCAYCGEKMYTTIRAHHHTEVVDGVLQDVTTKIN